MKKLLIGIIFVLWMLLTTMLIFSIIGWIALAPDDWNNKKSTWMQIGIDLLNELKR